MISTGSVGFHSAFAVLAAKNPTLKKVLATTLETPTLKYDGTASSLVKR
jgi:hypothetical protein